MSAAKQRKAFTDAAGGAVLAAHAAAGVRAAALTGDNGLIVELTRDQVVSLTQTPWRVAVIILSEERRSSL